MTPGIKKSELWRSSQDREEKNSRRKKIEAIFENNFACKSGAPMG